MGECVCCKQRTAQCPLLGEITGARDIMTRHIYLLVPEFMRRLQLVRTLAAQDSVLLSSVTFTGTSPLSRYFNSSRSLLGGNYPTFTQEWHACLNNLVVRQKGKASKSTTPRTALSFQEELPWVGFEPTTLQSRRALYQLSYQANSAGMHIKLQITQHNNALYGRGIEQAKCH